MTSAITIVQVSGTRQIKVPRDEMTSAGTIPVVQVGGTSDIKVGETK